MPEYYCNERYVNHALPTLADANPGFLPDEMLWIYSGADKIFFSDIYCFRNYLYKLVEDADVKEKRPIDISIGFGRSRIQFIDLMLNWYETLNDLTMRITEDEEHFDDSDYMKMMDLTNKAQDLFVLDRMELVFEALEVDKLPSTFCRKDIGAAIALGDDSCVYETEDDLALMQLLIDCGYEPNWDKILKTDCSHEMVMLIISSVSSIYKCQACSMMCAKSAQLMEAVILKSERRYDETCRVKLTSKFKSEGDKKRIEEAIRNRNAQIR